MTITVQQMSRDALTLPPLAPCPSWCVLPSDHGWDTRTAADVTPDGTPIFERVHVGPAFGPFQINGSERTSLPGAVVTEIDADVADMFTDPAEVARLAKRAEDAAALLADIKQAADFPPPPCPAWCDQKPGHEYEYDDDDGNPGRYHSLDLTPGPITATVYAEEIQRGHSVTVGDLQIGVTIGGNLHTDYLTSTTQARVLAASLLAAAAAAEEITARAATS